MAFCSFIDIQENASQGKHCTLCNVKTTDAKGHVATSQHKQLYNTRLKIANNIKGFDCLWCGVELDSDSYDDIISHIKTPEHREVFSDIEELIDGDFIDMPESITSKVGSVYCTICKCYIGFYYDIIKTHTNGRNHKFKRCNKVKSLNGIFEVEGTDEKLWCKICNDYIENNVEEVLSHVDECEEHNKFIDALDDDDNILTDDYMTKLNHHTAFCKLCNCNIPCNDNNVPQHISGENHRINKADAIKNEKGIVNYTDNNDELYCHICKDSLDNTVDDIFEHINNEDHCECYENIMNIIEGHNIVIKGMEAFCYKCYTSVPCNNDNLEKHVFGSKHKS